jgi:anti-sigma factor RsiW
MSACANVGPLLDGYHDGELDAIERNRVESHLTTCAVCRTDLASLGAVGRAVRAAVSGTDSPDLWDAIARDLPQSRAPRPAPARRRAPGRRRWLPAAAAAASLYLLVGPDALLPGGEDAGASGVVRSLYAPERSVMVLEAEQGDDPTIIWVMDEATEGATHVRI